MADELGTAVLKITVDDGPARQKLNELRQEISRSTRVAGGGGRTAGGARESVQALERAQSRRFALAQRIERLEERGAEVARLRARLGDLTTAQSQRQFGTARQLSVELDRQVKLVNARFRREQDIAGVIARQARLGGPRESVTGRRGLQGSPADLAFLARQGGARSPVGGAANIPGSPAFLAAQQRSAQQQAAILSAEIARQARLGGARSSVRGATDIPGSPAFLAAQKRAGEVQARAYVTEVSRLARQGGARSPIGGAVDIPGSPAFLAAQRRFSAQDLSRAAAIGGPRSPIGGAANIFGSPAFLARAASIGGPSSPIGGALNLPGSPAALKAEQRLAEARAKAAKAANDAAVAEGRRIGLQNAVPVTGSTATGLIPGSPAAINAAAAQRRRDLKEGRRIGSLNTSPVRGGSAFPGSPAFLDAQFPAFPADFFRTQQREQAKQQRLLQQRSKRRQDILSNALIGGAFPALFGQGLGASLGGAAGGAAGGAIGGQFGFGLSLVGTALGAQVDVAIQKFRDLAKALDDPIKNFDLLVQNASLSSKEVEKYAQALINSGRSAEAAAVIQSDLIDTFGSAQGAKEYNNAIDTLSRSWSKATTILAGFVAGPLAALIRQLEQPTSGAAIGFSFEQLAGQLTPEQYSQVQTRREQATEASRLSRGGLSALLPPSNEDVNAGLKAGIALAKELLGIERQRAEIAARIAFAQILSRKALSTSYELINASVQGYTLQALQKQKEVALNERNIALLQLTPEQRRGPEGQKIQQDTALKVYELDVQINDLRKERVALATEEAAKYQLAGEKLQQELKAVQALAALSQNAQRSAQFAVQQSTLQTIQGVGSSVGDAQRREREIGAQISAARIRGGDAGEQEAARLVNEQKLAAQQTRLELEEGSLALTQAGIKLREDVEAAFLSLQKLRTGAGGLNQFLNPQDRVNQERQTFEALLPSFREAQEQFKQLRGVNYAPEFSGSTSGVNQSILQFIDAVKVEQQALDVTADTQKALSDNTAALAKINTDLALVIQNLADKNWGVNVQVAANGTSQVFGDAQNSALSVPQ